VGRLVAYKKMDVAVAACLQAGVKLKVVGSGAQLKKLQKMVQKNQGENLVQFLGNVGDAKLQKLYSEAKAVLMIGEEDFGIVALEANAAGTIVVGHKNSGSLEILPAAAKVELPKSTLTDTIYAIKEVENRADLTAPRVASNFDQSHFMDKWRETL
jgi:glycosyltransferase involved in cell wall biosynthesis